MDLDKKLISKSNFNDYERNSISDGFFSSINKLDNHELLDKQQLDSSLNQESMYKVNLAAALHDHISCTKLQSDLRTDDGFLNLNLDDNKHLINDDLNDEEFSLTEQDFALKDIIMSQLDLIQYQQEQLLKKERQLQSVKQDRDQLIKKLDNMEKEINNLKEQLLKKDENKLITNQIIEISKEVNKDQTTDLCLTTGELTFCNFLTDPSNLLNTTATTIFTSTDQNLQQPLQQQFQQITINKSPIIQTTQLTTNKTNEIEPMEIEINKKDTDKKKKKSNKNLDKKIDKLDNKDLSDDKKNNLIKKKSTKKSNDKQIVNKDNKKSIDDKQHKVNQSDQSDTQINNEQSYIQLPIKTIETDNPYELVTNKDFFDSFDDNDLDRDSEIKLTNQSNIEIPSFRLNPLSCSYSLEGTENLNDEVFSRRHSKYENDERRRKRWETQQLRERLNNERLRERSSRSGSTNSKINNLNSSTSSTSNSQTVNTIDNQQDVSFYPNQHHLKYIEVSDKLPVIAFGHSIPELPIKNLKLPWNNSNNSKNSK